MSAATENRPDGRGDTPPSGKAAALEAAPGEPGVGELYQLLRLRLTVDLDTANQFIGIGKTLAYDLIRAGEYPVPILRLGKKRLVRTADLLTWAGWPLVAA